MSAPAPSMYSEAALEVIDRLGLRKGRTNLEVFAETLQELATADPNLLVVTSDSRGSGKLVPYGQALPEQIIEVGIAEQNLVGITAGLALSGKKVFGVSPACFLTARSLEQIKNDICYSNAPAVVVGISAGVSYGALGSTHHSLHDFAALRAINNITVIAPADNCETRAAVRLAAQAERPVYLRFGKAAMYDLYDDDPSIADGSACLLRDGTDIAFLATGETVVHALLAATKLEEAGISARVLSMHTVKPLDEDAVVAAGEECTAVITVEEHMINGGLGEAVAGVLLEQKLSPAFHRIGIPDEDTVTGAQADIFRHYGISMEGLESAAHALLD